MHAAEPMPKDPAINDLLMRVMTDHGITQRSLAEWLDLDRSAVTRMVNGNAAVTVDAIRALYRITRDPRLAQVIADVGDTLLLDLSDPDVERADVDVATLIISLNAVQSVTLDRLGNTPRSDARTTAAIDTAVKHLLRFRRRVTRQEQVPLAYRRARAPARV